MKISWNLLIIGFSCISFATACGKTESNSQVSSSQVVVANFNSNSTIAVANLKPTQGNQTSGKVNFKAENNGVLVTADLTGLPPGKYGLNIHEKGDCSAPDAKSAGGHFAPNGNPHGAPDAPENERHVGDIAHITADNSGNVKYNRVDKLIKLNGDNSIVGKAVIVSDEENALNEDDAKRFACGVIEMQT